LVAGETRADRRGVKPRAAGAALPAAFYARPTADVARRLLGHVLVSDVGGRRTAGRIVEVEAYVGPHDPACHAYGSRRTARTEQLYGPPGSAYVYFTYGMHWCLNAVTEAVGYPAAVLIRALEPMAGLETMRRRRGARDRNLCAGPARLCQALGVTGALNGAPLQRGTLRIVRGPRAALRPDKIVAGPRIGITRATDWPLRFYILDSPWVSGVR
jgi:DNA-3-methyladenine glycosylase